MWHTIIAAGVVARPPEMRYTPAGKAVTSLSLAVSDGFGDSRKTIWLRVTCWERLAETVNEYAKVKSRVLVEGRLVSDEKGSPNVFTRRDGTAGASFEVTASTVRFLSSKSDSEGDGESEPQREQLDETPSDIPF